MKKYYLYILGCAMNYSDAEKLATVLKDNGYQPSLEAEADIVLVVACSVRQKAIDRIYGKSKVWNKLRTKNSNFKTVLSGCVLPGDKKKLTDSFDLIFDISEIGKLEDFLKGATSTKEAKAKNGLGEYFMAVPDRVSSFRAFVPIMTGCDNFCSYCAVPYTRGREKSRPTKEIVDECKELVARGYKEITLLGQNVNSYANNSKNKTQNTKNRFAELLREIDDIEGDYKVYFYSNHPKDFSEELIKILPQLRHFPAYIHLPLQSGDDDILRRMNRRYTSAEYLALVKKIRERLPGVTLTTDIIVGFPGEDQAAFDKTLEVVEKAKFEMIFIGQYSPRLGTASAKMKDSVPQETKKERDRVLTELLATNLEKKNKALIGQRLKVLVDEKKFDKYYGRTAGYKVVEIKTDQSLEIGRFYDVLIEGSEPWKLMATLSD